MGSIRQPSRILKRRTRSGGPAERTVKGVPAFFVGAYVPESLYAKLTTDAAENERSISGQLIFLLKTHYLKTSADFENS